MPTRAIRYLRVSTSAQVSDKRWGYARQRITAQLSEQKHGLEVVAEVSDEISGAISERPGLATLPQVAREHGAVAVSLSELARLSRDLPGGYGILTELINTKLDIYASNLTRRVNFRDPQSVKEVNDALREAFMERHNIRDRTYAGLLAKAVDGYTRRPLNLYGYLNGAVHPSQAQWVEQSFELGLSTGTPSIAAEINERGGRSSRGGLWNHRSINDMLKDATYKGLSGFGRELYCAMCHETRQGHQRDVHRGYGVCARCGGQMRLNRIDIAVPAIVAVEMWEAVQEALRARNVKPGRRGKRLDTYPLTGRISCGVCGSAMSGMSAVADYDYYRCGASRRSVPGKTRCSHRSGYRNTTIHQVVLRALQNLVDSPGVLEALLAAQELDPFAKERQLADDKRIRLSERLQRAKDGYKAGGLDLEDLVSERKTVEAGLSSIPSYPPPARRRDDPEALRDRIRVALSESPLHEIVTGLGVNVILAPNKIAISVV